MHKPPMTVFAAMILGLCFAALPADAGAAEEQPSPRVRQVLSLAESASGRLPALEKLVSGGGTKEEISQSAALMAGEMRKARRSAEWAAANGERGIKPALERVLEITAQIKDALTALRRQSPDQSKSALDKARKEAVKTAESCSRSLGDLAEGKPRPSEDLFEQTGQPTGLTPVNPSQDISVGGQ